MERETNMRICPYNEQHLVHRSRFVKHILKCAKNYPPKYKESCPFNATHIMFRSELEEHMNLCPDKRGANPELYSFVKKHGSLNTPSPSEIEEALTCVDTWDGNIENRLKDFTDTSSVASDTDESTCTLYNPVKPPTNDMKPLRPPRGYGLPIMMQFGDNNGRDDVESVMSSHSVSTLAPGGRGIRPPSATPLSSPAFLGRGGGRKHV
ncbi:gametocyte-specific factor 1 [Diachasma alloeum]|uniref:gametocyte-specific factor 1 n=1 Tax=Diachasma alloeum TaxID=454923 RepID=UPI0007382517|nr:gametocyte-specific factor 1 [Diachasma alloeum]